MNPMDQAFIKAYAKDKPAGSPSGPVAASSTGPAPAPHYPQPYGVPGPPGQPVPPANYPPAVPTQWIGGQGLRMEAGPTGPSGPWSSGTIPPAHVSFPPNQVAPPQAYPAYYPTGAGYAPAYGETYPPPSYQQAPNFPLSPNYQQPPNQPVGYAPQAYAPPPASTPHPVAAPSWATTGHETAEIDVSKLAAEWLPEVPAAANQPAPPVVEQPKANRPITRVDAPAPPVEPTAEAINALDTAVNSEEAVEDKIATRFDEAQAALAGPHFGKAPVPETKPETKAETPRPEPAETIKIDEAPAREEGYDELAAPLLAVWEVDRFQWPDSAIKLHREYSYFAQAGKKLKAAASQGLKVLGVTGLSRGEGRTLLTLCLARSAAAEGVNAVVIDADFNKPDLAGALGLEVSNGWQEASQGKISLAESAVYSVDDRLTLLPLTGDVKKFSLRDRRVQAVLKEASRLFDVVLIDLGPMAEMGDDVWSIANRPPIDAAIVVCDLRQHKLDEVREAAVKLQAAGVEAVGIAENFSAG